MKQRDIYWADLNPVKGAEQSGFRPVAIISGNTMNENLGVCIVCPISSKIKNYAGCVQIKKSETNNLSPDSEIIAFQVRTVAESRLKEKIGTITTEEFEQILQELSDVLRY